MDPDQPAGLSHAEGDGEAWLGMSTSNLCPI